MSSAVQLLRKIVADRLKQKTFGNCLNRVIVVSGSNGGCVCEMKVTEEYQNTGGTLHGGMTATLVDEVSTWGLLAEKNIPGVSVDLTIAYINSAKVGEEIIIESKPLKIGKTLAFFSVDVRNKQNGNLLAQGRHTKHLGNPAPEKL